MNDPDAQLLNFYKNGFVSNELLTNYVLQKYHQHQFTPAYIALEKFYNDLQYHILQFECYVWFDAGLQRYIQKCEDRGLSCHYCMCYSIASRTLIKLHDSSIQITLIAGTDEVRHSMGYHSIYGQGHEILELMRIMINSWSHRGGVGDRDFSSILKPDESVGIL